MQKERDSCLLLFLKFPISGTVKTRLAREMGERSAIELYRCLVADTVALSRLAGYHTMVLFDPPEAREATAEWLGAGFTYEPQQGAGLGERMYLALELALKDWSKAVLMGSDIPGLPPAFLHRAFHALEKNDAVIGPALDGGYYLIGFSRRGLFAGAFEQVAWGSGQVFRATMEALEKRKVSTRVLQAWGDLDTFQDVQAFFLAHRHLPPGRLSTLDYLRARYRW